MKLKFWKREKELPPLPPIEPLKPPIGAEATTMENVKAKMDLILTQLDSLRVQNETLSERIKTIEKCMVEILEIAKSEVK
jgi:hypothetical protein